MVQCVFRVGLLLLAVAFASRLSAAPIAPLELRVSDTPGWSGAELAVTGVSTHPHFRVRYATDSTPFPASKLRVQVSTDESLAALLWDSGFVQVDPASSGALTSAVAYAGPPLAAGGTYYWRAALQDDQGVAGAFSEVRSFSVAEPFTAVDLRATTGIGAETLQGNPIVVRSWPLLLSAELFDTGGDSVSYAHVQVSKSSDFEAIVWESEVVPIGLTNPGERTLPVPYGGVQLEPGLPLFWRMSLSSDGESFGLWSSSGASFMYLPLDPTAPSPGGFSRASGLVGTGYEHASDVVLADVNGNGVPDAIAISGDVGTQNVIFPDAGTGTPGAPISFGMGRGGNALGCAGDFDLDGAPDIVIVDQFGLLMYGLDPLGGVTDLGDYAIASYGEPVAIQVADTNWDGWLDIVVAYELDVICVQGSESGFTSIQSVASLSHTVTSLLVTDYNIDDAMNEVWIVCNNGVSLVRGTADGQFSGLIQRWDALSITQIAAADAGDSFLPEIIGAGATSITHFSVSDTGRLGGATLLADHTVNHGFDAPCIDVFGQDMTGDGENDVVLLVQCTASLWRSVDGSYELFEFIGHPGRPATQVGVRVADANMDGFPDVLVARSDTPSEIFFNDARIAVSIQDSQATQVEFGEAYAVFEVVLDSTPQSMVRVECETYEEEGAGEGDSDGDRFPDTNDLVNAQASLLPYMPTSKYLVFVPGQTVAYFRVPLTRYFSATAWTLRARIVGVYGAYTFRSTAAAPIYFTNPGGGSSGPSGSPGLHRDWRVNGEVRDSVQLAGGNTYFGGDFDGISWEAKGVAALTPVGERRLELPKLSSGSIYTVAVAPDGAIYLGGDFTIDLQPTGQIKNIAKCEENGSLATYFAPNPNGPVHAIAFNETAAVYNGLVYFGGEFSLLAGCPGMNFNNLAFMFSNGGYATGTYGASAFGVKNSGTGTCKVKAIKLAKSGNLGADYLLVGGIGITQALRYGTPVASPLNFVGFAIPGSSSSYNPDLFYPRFNSAVNAIEVDPTKTMASGTSAIIIGGSFTHGTYASGSGSSGYVTLTDFWGSPASAVSCPTEVNALKRDSSGRLWIGRRPYNYFEIGQPYHDPVAVFGWQGFSLIQQSTPGSNIAFGNVRALANSGTEMLVAGDFSVIESGQLVAQDMAVYSTQAAQLKVRSIGFVGQVNSYGSLFAAAPTFNSAGHNGYLVCGQFTELVAQRKNLAAMDASGHLLAWGPAVDGPVNALAADGAIVFVGGAFSSVGGQTRRCLAAVFGDNVSVSPLGWNADVFGTGGTPAVVRSLAVEVAVPDSYLIVGGNFAVIGGVARNDVAALDTQQGQVASWNPDLSNSSGDGVHSLLVDSLRVFIGGSFPGTNAISRPGAIAVDVPSGGTGQLDGWDAQLNAGCTVRGLAATSYEIAFVGDFTSVQGAPRAGAASLQKFTPYAVGDLQPSSNGEFTCVEAVWGGLIYLGGDFSTVVSNINQAGSAVSRKGIAIFDTAGVLQNWAPDVVQPSRAESVLSLHVETGAGLDKLWVSGRFDGVTAADEDAITWFNSAWYITTTSLPAADSGQAYSTVGSIQLSQLLSCTWDIFAPGAPSLQIDSQGVVYGTAPSVPHAPPQTIPVRISAIGAPGTASRWFMLTVNPPPPAVLVRISSTPSTVLEGDTAVLTPTLAWTVTLMQSFSVPVYVSVDYTEFGALEGYDFKSLFDTVIFYPTGTTVPAVLPPRTIATSLLSLDLPVIIYGNTRPDTQIRKFRIRITSQTANVEADPGMREATVQILDDDQSPPVPVLAFVAQARVLENATTIADPSGVVADMPFISWVFGTEVSGTLQDSWQVQVNQDPMFPGVPFFESGQITGQQQMVQVTTPLHPVGTDWYARVRVSAGGGQWSEWYTFAFHRNIPPQQAYGLSPSGSVATARPILSWMITDDLEGNAQHVVVHLKEASGAGLSYLIDSRATPSAFEYELSSGWYPVAQSGIPPGVTNVRMLVPQAMSLTQPMSQWDWWVDVSDPHELAAGTVVNSFTFVPGYRIEGVYKDSSGLPLAGRMLNAVLLTNHGSLHTSSIPTGPQGEFTVIVNQVLAPGEAIVLCLDPATSFGESACVVLRFTGTDLVGPDGPFREVHLVSGTCLLDARGQGAFNLADFVPPPPPIVPVPGFPFTFVSGAIELDASYDRLELASKLRVRGTYAPPGEPSTLRAVSGSQIVATTGEGCLSIEEGATTELRVLDNGGSTLIETGAVMTLMASSTSDGLFTMEVNGTIVLSNASLSVTGGSFSLSSGTLAGTVGTEGLVLDGGSVSLAGTGFADASLDVGHSG